MALQIWLPLNKSGADKNQGLGDSTITNFGAVYESSGKLGGCYKCTNSAGIRIESKSWMHMVPGNSFSISMWIKGCSVNTRLIACGSWEIIFRTNILAVYPGESIANGGCSINQIFDTNTWYHIAFSYDGNTSKLSLYLNGEFKQEYITTYRHSGINSTITLPYGYTRYINDFRLYDECLSPKEVKEISKGLVLHYPLNDAYVEGTVNLGNTSLSYSDKTEGYEYTANSWGGTAGTVTYYKSGGYNNLPYKVYHKTASGSGGIYDATKRDISIVAGKTYTMSIWVKASRNFSAIHYSFNINGITSADSNHYITYGKNVPFTTEWTRLSRTFTATELDAGIYTEQSIIYDNWDTDYYVYFSGFQIEEKDHATPYIPNTRNETTVYDCSGYQNNGTISGSLSCSIDSPRYKISTVFDGTSAKIINESFPTSIVNGTNPFTICGWAYCIKGNSYYPLFHIGSNYRTTTGICLHGNGNRIEGLDINGTIIDNTYGSEYSNEKWVHQCVVYDGTTIKRYLNGNSTPVQSIACPGFKSDNNILSVGGFWGGTFKGYLSDFRVYAAALSAEDIKELYNTSAYVLDNGTLLTYSVEE